jgi:predicted amidohydrolase YtcJ
VSLRDMKPVEIEKAQVVLTVMDGKVVYEGK